MWYSEQQLTEIIIKAVSVATETYNHNRRQIKQHHLKNATPRPYTMYLLTEQSMIQNC
jgi:hypothetical protein